MTPSVTLNFKNGDYLTIPNDAIYGLRIDTIIKNKKMVNHHLESYNTAKAIIITLDCDAINVLKTMYMQEGVYNDDDTLGRLQYGDIISLTLDETILVPWKGDDTNSYQTSNITASDKSILNITIDENNDNNHQ